MRTKITLLSFVLTVAATANAQSHPTSAAPSLTIHAVSVPVSADALMAGERAWNQVPALKLTLNRTPNLYDTDPPPASEISSAEVRAARVGGKLFIRLTWRDATKDVADLEPVPPGAPETRFHKALVQSTDRFFDAAAVMAPMNAPGNGLSPSLQMGDAQQPVRIYYWNSVRGAMLMEAQGRGTTKRTGQSFPAQGSYRSGEWTVVFELPDLPRGTPFSFAVWNGSQQDRDGRKYFSVWQVME